MNGRAPRHPQAVRHGNDAEVVGCAFFFRHDRGGAPVDHGIGERRKNQPRTVGQACAFWVNEGRDVFFSRSRPRPALLSVNRAAVDGGHVVTNGYRWLFATAPPAYLAMVTVRLTGIARAAVGLRRTKAGAGAGRFTGAGPPAELHRRRPLRLRQRGSRLR